MKPCCSCKFWVAEGASCLKREWQGRAAAPGCQLFENMVDRPCVVCLCGSTRFSETFQKANLDETLAGNIVLSIGCNLRTDDEIFGHLSPKEVARVKGDLDWLHLRKIDLADEVLILNVGGYIGDSTKRELAYARACGKPVRFLEPEHVD